MALNDLPRLLDTLPGFREMIETLKGLIRDADEQPEAAVEEPRGAEMPDNLSELAGGRRIVLHDRSPRRIRIRAQRRPSGYPGGRHVVDGRGAAHGWTMIFTAVSLWWMSVSMP